ncbi:NAD(P)/FAD-dependent oxidoreductase [Streptomyces sp. JJ66]|uniref:flavin-containing monooxygenase n=1 Tax=Streptomyces sp. JJ66 TaxID=2803843 RepID=UPI0027E2CBAD|nr:NAD(P)/FAD-dependent oxidoreductase [Streptomyces sp. JJ66]
MPPPPEPRPEHVDVLIIGAGLSGIGAACHLRRESPDHSYAVLESREASGGTWDLFRYPGVRSDSDMFTLGYSFRPWPGEKALADGASILRYVRDTARAYGVDQHIRYRHTVVRAQWSSAQARWTVHAERTDTGEPAVFTCAFLHACTGYYRYDEGYAPPFPGRERFTGPVVHPQQWPEGLDVTGQRVVVIGSGATAVTLVPSLAERGARVTMLQRSPSYVTTLAARDPIARLLRGTLPAKAAYAAVRWKNVLVQLGSYQLSRRQPKLMKALLRRGLRRWLPANYAIDTHFAPRYNPWDQRLCLVPDGDLFRALRAGTAEIVTDHIDTFTETGLALRSGAALEADVIVTATGLNVRLLGGLTLTVDGQVVDPAHTVAYKGMMLSGVPNFALTLGYTHASWTLKADLVARYVCRVLNHLRDTGRQVATPTPPPFTGDGELSPLLDLTSGYVQRSLATLPRQGPSAPWRLHQNYLRDLRLMRRAPVDDGWLRFTSPTPPPSTETEPQAPARA